MIAPLLVLVLALVAAPAGARCADPAAAPALQDDAVRKYHERKAAVDSAAAGRYLEIAEWCVDKGLYGQAKEQFSVAISRSRGAVNEKANAALAALQSLSPEQIRKKFRRPGERELKLYRLKVSRAVLDDRRGVKKLADEAWAAGENLEAVAAESYRALVDSAVDMPEVDDSGCIVLGVGTVPSEVSRSILDSGGAITVNGRLRVRSALMRRVPSVDSVHMARADDLVVFSDRNREEAESLREMGEALLPHLRKVLGKSPDRPLNVCVFHATESYAEYCARSGHDGYAVSNGFTNLEDFVSVVRVPDPDGRDLTDYQVRCIVLHEMVHLFQFAVTLAEMPSWYAEGLAETFGGAGTFEWDRDAKRLRVGGLLERRRIDVLKVPGNLFGLEEFLGLDALELHSLDREMTERFYTQAWAFLRFLRTGAGRATANKLEDWERMCRHARLDADRARSRFRYVIKGDREKLERDFRAFVKKL